MASWLTCSHRVGTRLLSDALVAIFAYTACLALTSIATCHALSLIIFCSHAPSAECNGPQPSALSPNVALFVAQVQQLVAQSPHAHSYTLPQQALLLQSP